jgi:tmRNA-binding protein
MVYIDPRAAAQVRARKALLHKQEVERINRANREAMAYVAGLRKAEGK